MKKILYAALAVTLLSSLSACMVVPPYDAYGGPGVTVVAPAPYFYGGSYRHHHYRDGGYRRW